MTLRVELPDKIATVLGSDKRYKVLYGGRGGGKSWSIARMLLALGTIEAKRIMCARELQTSLAESVHQLLSDLIDTMELHGYYKIQKNRIIGKAGTTAEGTIFLFSGIKDAKNIKSFEAIEIFWVEEAQTVSFESWEILIPTVRKAGSEIWVSFNPLLDDDDTYVRFILNPSEDTAIAKINFYDNPWCTQITRDEAAKLKAKNLTQYEHVYEGECVTAVEGAVFTMSDFGRFLRLPEDPIMIVHSWDTAYKAGQHNDPSVCTVWHVTKSAVYLANVIRGRWQYPELKKRAIALAKEDNPDLILIEDKASGQSLIQEMKEETAHNIIAINPEGDKETRARVSAAPIAAGRVLLPQQAEWLHEFEREIMLFPPPHGSKIHDDQVDSMSQFLIYMQKKKPTSFADTMRELYGVQ